MLPRIAPLVGIMLLFQVAPAQQVLFVPSAHPTIQSAINLASAGDTVAVLPGVYDETIDFLGKSITVVSTDGPSTTSIDRQNQGRCAVFTNGETPSARLEGFTLTGGRAPNGAPVISGPGNTGGHGGAVFCTGAPTIVNCIITGNRAGDGSNGSFFEPAGAGGSGGGVYTSGSATLIGCLITNNDVGIGGQITFPGAAGTGGGIAIAGFPAPTVTLLNCTIARNGFTGPVSAGVSVTAFQPNMFVTNSIVRGNAGPELTPASAFTVSFSHVEGGFAGTGNVAADPLFVSPINDFRLQPGSPAIGAGDGGVAGLPASDLDGGPRLAYGDLDLGAYEATDIWASPCVIGNVGSGVGGPFDVLTVNGSAGGAARRVTVAMGGSLALGMVQPPGTATPAGFAIFGLAGEAGPADPVVLPFGIGTMCFTPCPLLPASSAHFTVTNNLGPSACLDLLPSTPTPWSVTITAPPVAVTATLQGVLVLNGTSVVISNGLVLEVN